MQPSIKSNLCDYSDAFILVTEDITVNAGNNIDVPFKKCAPFSTCKTEINDIFVDEANHIYNAMPMYNLIEHKNNYSDKWGTLWQFKRDEVQNNNNDLTVDNSQSFKYKAALVGQAKDTNGGNSAIKKIVVQLNYLSNLWISLEMPLTNCKIHLEINWIGLKTVFYKVMEVFQNLK